jgi:hypothetical protein
LRSRTRQESRRIDGLPSSVASRNIWAKEPFGFFSPCGTCLDRGRAQLYLVTKPLFYFLGVTADPITDGMLIPWQSDGIRGTIWAVAHGSTAAFDLDNYQLLRSWSDFIAIFLRHQANNPQARHTARAEASAERAHTMAHQIQQPVAKPDEYSLSRVSGRPRCSDVY